MPVLAQADDAYRRQDGACKYAACEETKIQIEPSNIAILRRTATTVDRYPLRTDRSANHK